MTQINVEQKQPLPFRKIEHRWVRMSDGVRLSARLWLPDLPHQQACPAIFEYIPYRKRDMVRSRDERNHTYFASHGYACVRVDIRGSGDSEGLMTDMYHPEELNDAIEIINWIANEPWCNGSVGMMGTSWGGTSSLQAASRRPEPLKAVIVACATDNRFDDDIHHMGGCLLTDTVEWGATLPAILALPPDPETVGAQWRDIWNTRLDGLAFPLENWVRHESKDTYWRWGAVSETSHAIACPILAVGGWADRYSNTVMNLMSRSKNNCWGIVGPWGHHYPDVGTPGPAMGFQQEALRWWNHWLKGEDNGVDREPRLRVWMQEATTLDDSLDTRAGRWISEPVWPSNRDTVVDYWLNNNFLQKKQSAEQSSIQVPPTLEVGSASGDTGYFGRPGGLPLNQRSEDEHSLVFETEALEQSMEILGAVGLLLTLETDRPVSTLSARLNEVRSDGSVSRACYVVQNLALDMDGNTLPEEDARAQTRTLVFNNTAYRFAKGSKIRLALSTSYWPLTWPQGGASNVTLHLKDCRLSLPVRKARPEEPVKLAPASVPPGTRACNVLSAPPLVRETDINNDTGTRTVSWHQPLYEVHHTDIDLNFSYETKARHHIDTTNYNSASSRFEHRFLMGRKDWRVEIISIAELTSTETEFRLSGQIRVMENGETIFERQWAPTVARTCS